MPEYHVYTDGSADNRPDSRVGGWAYAILYDHRPLVLAYSPEPHRAVTSNVMEMTAALGALRALHRLRSGEGTVAAAVVHCDSQYVVRGVTQWREGWERSGWVASNNKPVANRLLWKELHRWHDQCRALAPLEWRWVRGHDGNYWNEAVDKLACYHRSSAEKDALAAQYRAHAAR